MKIAVTGGGGFIGATTIRAAEQAGHAAFPFDRAHGDDVLDNLAGLDGANAVIHLAGMLGTAELFDDPEAAVQANVVGTLRVLQWCDANRARYVGITMPDSSWANVYQATKLCATRLASAWHRNHGVPVSHVRAFNAYGPGQKHGPGHPQKIIPTFASLAWAGRPLPIWGSGLQSVDLVHVDDVARILVAATRFGDDQIFDAGTSTPVTVRKVAYYINRYTGNPAGVEYLPMRAGETPDTHIRAEGEGWDLVEPPRFGWTMLDETIDSYRP